MQSVIAFGLAASAALVGAEASAPVVQPAAATGKVVFVGALPDALGALGAAGAAGGATGSIKLKGEKPELKPLVIEPAKSEGCVHGGGSVDTTDQTLIVGEGGGIANVVVMVSVEGAQAKVPDAPVHLDQKSCRYEPHVSVVAQGTTVEFLNSDGVSHNVHTYAKKNDQFNKTVGAGSKETQKLDKPDQIEIKCDIHPWMNAWLIVTDAPFFAVTDSKGEFKIEGLPAGTHEVEFWHEKLGKNKGEITVAADGTGTMSPLEWGLEEKSSGGRRR
jgi:plastocyanin